MNCTICSQPTLLGAKLCTACSSALKRARDESVVDLPKGPAAPAWDRRRTPRQASKGADHSAAIVATPVRLLRRRSGYAALAGLAATVLAVSYLSGQSFDARETPVADASAAPRAVPLPALVPATAGPPPIPRAALPVPVVQETVRVEISPTPSVSPPQEQSAKAAALRPNSAITSAKAPAGKLGGPASPGNGEAMTAFGYAVEPTRPTRVPSPPPVVVAQAAAERDRWPILTDSLNRCGREAFFSRPGCEQRARAQHCAGFWGQAPQCPNPIQNDQGQ